MMKRIIKATVMATVMTLLSTGCSDKASGDANSPAGPIEKQEYTPEVLNSFGRVSNPQISPDGKKVLFAVGQPNIKENRVNSDLWVIDIDGQNAKKITDTPRSEGNAVWIDGGNKIAFTYCDDKEGAVTQVWVMNADGSGRKQVSKMEKDVEGFLLSPDEKKIAIVSTVKYNTTAQDKYPELDKANARIIDDLMYRHWNEWTAEVPQPYVGNFDGKEVTDVKNVLEGTLFESPMRPWGGVEEFAWTPDSKQFIYACRKKVGKDYALSTNSDLYVYDTEKGETTQNLTEGMMGYDNMPIFSKSGKLAWLSMERDGYEADKNRIFMMDKLGGEKVDLTANWDYSVDAIAWSPDEKYIYFIGAFEGTMPIMRVDVATQKVDTIAAGNYDYDTMSFVDDSNMVVTRHSFMAPNEIFTLKLGEEPKQISNVNTQLLASLDEITCEKMLIKATDGKDIHTWVLFPPNFDKNKQYPAIFFCEGGPQSPVSQAWSYRWNFRIMANHGYIVIMPNRRGLPGFGTEWNEQISGDYAGQCMKDYLSVTDYMAQQPYVDEKHIGCVGASFGGYSVYWLAGNHNKRYACFLSHAGIFDLRAQYLETEEMWFVNWDLGGAPWDKDNAVAQKSFAQADPKNFVQNWDTPIMVTTGENDFRICYTQTMQAFNAAKLLGIPAHMVLYPEECHWVVKPQNSIVWQNEFFEWLDKWLMPSEKANG